MYYTNILRQRQKSQPGSGLYYRTPDFQGNDGVLWRRRKGGKGSNKAAIFEGRQPKLATSIEKTAGRKWALMKSKKAP